MTIRETRPSEYLAAGRHSRYRRQMCRCIQGSCVLRNENFRDKDSNWDRIWAFPTQRLSQFGPAKGVAFGAEKLLPTHATVDSIGGERSSGDRASRLCHRSYAVCGSSNVHVSLESRGCLIFRSDVLAESFGMLACNQIDGTAAEAAAGHACAIDSGLFACDLRHDVELTGT